MDQTPNESQTKTIDVPWWTYDCIDDRLQDRQFWITGGLGSGKTWGGAAWFLHRTSINANCQYSWAVAPTYAKAETVILPALVKVAADVFGMKVRQDYSITYGAPIKIKLPGGHQAHVHSGTRPELMAGDNIAHLWITECATQKRETYERASTRVRDTAAETNQTLCEGVPEGDGGWFADYANFTEGIHENGIDRRFIIHTEDNPNLPAGYVDRIKRLFPDKNRQDSYLYGIFRAFARGNAYWEFSDVRDIELSPPDLSPQRGVILSFDFNKSPLCWVLLQKIPLDLYGVRHHNYIALAEGDGTARGLIDACAQIVITLPPLTWAATPIDIYGDPSGWAGSHKTELSDFDQIKRYLKQFYKNVNVKASTSYPTQKQRLERVNSLFAYEMLKVSHNCPLLINSLRQTTLKEGTFDIDKPSGEYWTHPADAFGYPLVQLTDGLNLQEPGKPLNQVGGLNSRI